MFVAECNLKYVIAVAVSHVARPYTNYMCTVKSSNCDCCKEQALSHWEVTWLL